MTTADDADSHVVERGAARPAELLDLVDAVLLRGEASVATDANVQPRGRSLHGAHQTVAIGGCSELLDEHRLGHGQRVGDRGSGSTSSGVIGTGVVYIGPLTSSGDVESVRIMLCIAV